MKNIELKISLDNPEQIRKYLKTIGAQKQCVLRQTDTYFNTTKGRLKLREINNTKCELIYYERPNESGSRMSNYQITDIDNKDKSKVKGDLISARGEKVIVKKIENCGYINIHVYIWIPLKILENFLNWKQLF